MIDDDNVDNNRQQKGGSKKIFAVADIYVCNDKAAGSIKDFSVTNSK